MQKGKIKLLQLESEKWDKSSKSAITTCYIYHGMKLNLYIIFRTTFTSTLTAKIKILILRRTKFTSVFLNPWVCALFGPDLHTYSWILEFVLCLGQIYKRIPESLSLCFVWARFTCVFLNPWVWGRFTHIFLNPWVCALFGSDLQAYSWILEFVLCLGQIYTRIPESLSLCFFWARFTSVFLNPWVWALFVPDFQVYSWILEFVLCLGRIYTRIPESLSLCFVWARFTSLFLNPWVCALFGPDLQVYSWIL